MTKQQYRMGMCAIDTYVYLCVCTYFVGSIYICQFFSCICISDHSRQFFFFFGLLQMKSLVIDFRIFYVRSSASLATALSSTPFSSSLVSANCSPSTASLAVAFCASLFQFCWTIKLWYRTVLLDLQNLSKKFELFRSQLLIWLRAYSEGWPIELLHRFYVTLASI